MTTALAETTPGPTPDETIRRTVRALRSAYEVDAAVLARHLGISRGSLYNRLNGAAPWLAAEIVGLASFFNCEIADFYAGNVRITDAAKARVSGRYQGRSAEVVTLFPQVSATGTRPPMSGTRVGANRPGELRTAS